MGEESAENLLRGGKAPPKLYWHGSRDAVDRREMGGVFVDGPGNGGMFWSTSRKMNELGPFKFHVGGNTNVRTFPPRLVNKGGLEATYELTPAEAAQFRRAWGPNFNWNPYMWWKGASGQYYLRPFEASLRQRLGELAGGIGITSALGTGYVYHRLKERKD